MVGLAQISILAANVGHASGEFGINEGAEHGHDSPDHPGAENQNRSVDLPCDHVSVDEDAGTDDPAHDHHGGVEQADLSGERAHILSGFNRETIDVMHSRESYTHFMHDGADRNYTDC